MNVILLLTDQLSARWMGCYGCGAASTPNLDALAARGVRFDNCCVTHPVCMPSRASILTGRSAQHHGVYQSGYELGLDLPTFPQVLQGAGVQTFGVGKFHLECHGRSAYNDVLKYGFDRAETTEDHRAGDWLDWVEETHPQHYERALATVGGMSHLAGYGPNRRDLLAEVKAARAKYPPEETAQHAYSSIVPEEACQTHWVVDRALAFLEERDREKPFFLKASFVAPHSPYDPPARFLDRVDPDAVPPPANSEDGRLLAAIEHFREVPFHRRSAHLTGEDWRIIRHHYLASLAFIDEQVGRLLEYLDETGLDRETLVLFTSDHGDMLGDHGIPAKGAWHFDACIRVPLLVAGPGVQQGAVVRGMVSNLDLFPTITHFGDAGEEVRVEGKSLHPLLNGTGDLDRPDATLTESYQAYTGYDVRYWARTVRTPQAALTLFGNGQAMLFDLEADPDECVNLYGSPAAETTERQLKDLLLEAEWSRYHPLPRRGKHPTALY